MKFHPFSDVFPMLPEAELAELAADIKAFGLREPICVYQGMILDGRNRYLACQRTNTKLDTKQYTGTDKGAIALVKSANLRRRDLTPSQRAFAVAELANWLEKGRPIKSAPGADLSSQDIEIEHENDRKAVHDAAVEAGVSDRTMTDAKKVAKKGSRKIKDAVRSGKKSVKKAAAVVDLPKSEQLAAATAEPKPDLGEFVTEEEIAQTEADQKRYIESLERAAGDSAGEIKRLNQLLTAAYQARDRYMRESSAMRKQLERLERENKRLKKQLSTGEKKSSNGARAHA